MVASTQAFDTFQFSQLRNHLFVPVPWDRADELRARLQARGIPATACFEPSERTAGLEIHQEVDLQNLKSILSMPRC
jgi:hypothetical protein